FPKMREWVGDKNVKSLEAFNYTIRNKDWEATVEVDRNDIEDDQIMGYALQARDAGQSAAELPADIVASLINNGFTSPCYDGQMFFDTDHLVAGKSVSNKGTKKLKVGSLAEAKASYGAARTAMRSLKDDEGASLRIRPNLLVVPPALEDDANYLMTAEKFPDGTPNPYRNTAEVLVMPELTSDSAWFLFDTSRSVKPLIFQQRKKPVFVEQTDYNSDNVFMRKKFRFGAEARCNGGYGFWQMAFGS
ncbi:TPA: Mu-like prophage major head subunit gpT family protein, partial [Escherichia coli]|nr:Mu-like prophage major head subunit gpT family protein [Escherichia coli]